MNFIFIGGTFRGFSLFQALINKGYKPNYTYILKEDDHEQLRYSDQLSELATSAGVPCQVKKKLSRQDEEFICSEKRDFIIVCGWRTLINPSLNESLKLGMVAAHDSLLPKYRGFAPLNWAMINGEEETGVTLFLINSGEVDSGDVIAQARVKIEQGDYAYDVYKKVGEATVELYLDFIEKYQSGSIELKKQNELEATYTCKRVPEDGKLNWTLNSEDILNFIRALAPPFPGAFCLFNDRKYVIHKATAGNNDQKRFVRNIPGRVISINDAGIEVMCGKGSIEITEWEDIANQSRVSPSSVVRSITATLK